MQNDTLPENIDRQLSNLEERHKKHQAMLSDHHEEKHNRRERHRARNFQRKIIPITLI